MSLKDSSALSIFPLINGFGPNNPYTPHIASTISDNTGRHDVGENRQNFPDHIPDESSLYIASTSQANNSIIQRVCKYSLLCENMNVNNSDDE